MPTLSSQFGFLCTKQPFSLEKHTNYYTNKLCTKIFICTRPALSYIYIYKIRIHYKWLRYSTQSYRGCLYHFSFHFLHIYFPLKPAAIIIIIHCNVYTVHPKQTEKKNENPLISVTHIKSLFYSFKPPKNKAKKNMTFVVRLVDNTQKMLEKIA